MKKTLIERFSPTAVSNSAWVASGFAGAAVAATIAVNVAGAVADRAYDETYVNNLTQTKYEQKIEAAKSDLEYQLAIHRAMGVVPEVVELEKAKEIMKTEISPKYMAEATQEANDQKEYDVDKWELTMGLLAGLGGLLGGWKGTWNATEKLANDLEKARRRREREEGQIR